MDNSIHDGVSESNPPKAESVALKITVGDEVHYLDQGMVDDEDALDALRQQCEGAAEQVKISVKNLPAWPPEKRVSVLDFLLRLPGGILFFVRKGRQFSDLYESLVALVHEPSDLGQHQVTKVLALEGAALCYPDALEAACKKLLKRLRELGVKGVRVDGLISEARRVRKGIEHAIDGIAPPPGAIPIQETLEDAPTSEGVVVPAGWEVNRDGIYRCSAEGSLLVIRSPVLITERHIDTNRKTELLTLAWYRDSQWRTRVVDRGAIASSRTIVDELAPYGIPVTTNTAKDLIQFLDEFEAENLETLPVTRVSHRLGWQGEGGEAAFLLGSRLIIGESADSEAGNGVKFRGADEGDEQIAEGFHGQGTFAAWKKAIKRIKPFHRVRLALYAAFVPVLLRIFQSPNFIVDLAGRTTTGKTTAVRVAGSVWGNPDEQHTSSVVKTWDGTATWRERMPAVTNHLPVIFDDTRHVKNADEVAKTIYSVAQGVGRGRGSVKGLARQDTWQTVLLTTGEQPATSFTEDGGTRARVLSLWGSPFGASSPQMGKRARAINEAIKENFGHAGPQFVQFILDNREEWEGWRQEYREELRKFEELTEGNPFAARMAPHFAAIATAAWLAHEALDLPWEYEDPIEPLWDELVQEAGEADRAAAALRHVMDWAYAHQDEFFGRSPMDREPTRGWAGRWDSEQDNDAEFPKHNPPDKKWEWIGFIPARLTEILREGHFESESIIRAWQDQQWLKVTPEATGICRRMYTGRESDPKGSPRTSWPSSVALLTRFLPTDQVGGNSGNRVGTTETAKTVSIQLLTFNTHSLFPCSHLPA